MKKKKNIQTRVRGNKHLPEGKSWSAIDSALNRGYRGLLGRSSLVQLLQEKRGVRNIQNLTPHSIDQILGWIDLYYRKEKKYPNRESGTKHLPEGQSWSSIDRALKIRGRGLPGKSSLAQLLQEKRQVRNRRNLPPYSISQILKWVDLYYEKEKEYPNQSSGNKHLPEGETWSAINEALKKGQRGFPVGSSLAQLLQEKRGKRNPKNLPSCSVRQILSWMDLYYEKEKEYPNQNSGSKHLPEGENWNAIDSALNKGRRGFPEGSSLAKLLEEERGIRNRNNPSPLSISQILGWIDLYYRKEKKYPNQGSGNKHLPEGQSWGGNQCCVVRWRSRSSCRIFLSELAPGKTGGKEY